MIASASTVISGSAKDVTYLLVQIGFCFLPICLVWWAEWSRKCIPEKQLRWHGFVWAGENYLWEGIAMPFSRRSSWQGLKLHLLGLLPCKEGSLALELSGKPSGTPRTTSVFLMKFLGWNVSFVLLRSPLLRCLFLPFSFLRAGLWNAEGCPVPLNCSPDSSPCTSPASAVRSAAVSTHWGSGSPQCFGASFIPLLYRPPTEQQWWNINTSNWLLVMCRHFT